MRVFLIGVALLFSMAAAQAQDITEQARALVGYLNAELGKSLKLAPVDQFCLNLEPRFHRHMTPLGFS